MVQYYIHERIVSPALNQNPGNTRPDLYDSALSHFTSTPWCAAILQAPGAIPFIPPCRNPASTQDNQALGSSLATERTVPHMLCCFESSDPAHTRDPARLITRVRSFFATGHGVCGFPGVVQGGIVMAMIDEAMAAVMDINMLLGKEGTALQANCVTASMDMKFLKPVPIGEPICATAWIDGMEGRKIRLTCVMADGNGRELAKCASTWVALKSNI